MSVAVRPAAAKEGTAMWGRIAQVAFLVSIAVGLGGCKDAQVKKTAPAPYAEPELAFRGIGFENQSFTGTDVVFKFALVGQDERAGRVTGCPYKLEIRDGQTLRGTLQIEAAVEAGAEVPVRAKISVPWPEQREAIVAFLQRKRLPYKYHLTCELQAPTGPVAVSNSDGGTIPLPKLPELDIIQANAERFGDGSDVRINFELGLLNANTFRLGLDKIVYGIELAGQEVIADELPLAEVVPPSAEFTYDVTTPIFNEREHGEIMELLEQEQIAYHMKGALHIDGFELPIDVTGTISFPQAGLR